MGSIVLCRESIVPGTFQVDGLDSSHYRLEPFAAKLNWLRKKSLPDSATVRFRVFPFSFTEPARLYDFDSVKNTFFVRGNPVSPGGNAEEEKAPWERSKMNYNGSLARSISIGNAQDPVLNSQLNVQLSGYIGDSVEVAAAITDNNINIQPDGNTQQLNEFDRVTLQFRKKPWQLSIGDIELRENGSRFLGFYKRLQGLSYQTEPRNGSRGLFAGAVAKGKFTRFVLQPLEGNQGPYRLKGANNELYFTVLANTEKIFMDGELLQRGADKDYTINYNTAEITFMPRKLITKDKRIQAEFEYSDRNYLNSFLYATGSGSINRRAHIGIGLYRNGDARNSPINQTLDDKEKKFLADIGDSVQNAFYPIATQDSFSANRIMYAKRPVPGRTDSMYVYSVNKDSARYVLSFLEVGADKGDYVPLFNGSNGKVFRYVPRANGQRQGSYQPAEFLVSPKLLEVGTVTARIGVGKHGTLETDLGISRNDPNLFSKKDKGNDVGLAGRVALVRNGKTYFAKRTWEDRATVAYEFAEDKFKTVERLRPVEFTRDWGLPVQTAPASEKLPSIVYALRHGTADSVQMGLQGYRRSDGFQALRPNLRHHIRNKRWETSTDLNLTLLEQPGSKGTFLKPSLGFGRTLTPRTALNGSFAMEWNRQATYGTDSLLAASYAFRTYQLGLQGTGSKSTAWSLDYNHRRNFLPHGNAFALTDFSNNYRLALAVSPFAGHSVRTEVSYRQLKVADPSLINLGSDNSLIARTEYGYKTRKGVLTGNTFYEIGAGQEQQRDISYVSVPTGRGEYAWIDYNNDGIQQLNEFEIARFSDQAQYVRVFTPTNIFVKSFYNQFSHAVQFSPRNLFDPRDKHGGARGFVSRFDLRASLQASQKTLASAGPKYFPYSSGIADTALIALSRSFAHTVSFNRNSPVWGMDLNLTLNNAKNLLTYGLESRSNREWSMKARANIATRWLAECSGRTGLLGSATSSFSNKNYSIASLSAGPRLSYSPSPFFRLQAAYLHLRKQNATDLGGEKATDRTMSLEGRANAGNDYSLTAKFSYDRIDYLGGKGNQTIDYIMLDGLAQGKNYIWNLDVSKRLLRNLEVNLHYEGRRAGEQKVIHSGRASVRALL